MDRRVLLQIFCTMMIMDESSDVENADMEYRHGHRLMITIIVLFVFPRLRCARAIS